MGRRQLVLLVTVIALLAARRTRHTIFGIEAKCFGQILTVHTYLLHFVLLSLSRSRAMVRFRYHTITLAFALILLRYRNQFQRYYNNIVT